MRMNRFPQIPLRLSAPTTGARQSPRRRTTCICAAVGLALSGGLAGAQTFTYRAIALSGEHEPGLDATIAQFWSLPVMHASGRIIFSLRLEGPSVTAENDFVIVIDDGPGSTRRYIREGTTAPGLTEGEVLINPAHVPFTDSKQILFRADLAGPTVTPDNDHAIFLAFSDHENSMHISLLSRAGEQAAGLPPGVRYDQFGFYSGVNDSGDVAFIADLVGQGVTSSDDQALFVVRHGEQPVLITRSGDEVMSFGDFGTHMVRDHTIVQVSPNGDLTWSGTYDEYPGPRTGSGFTKLRTTPPGEPVLLTPPGRQALGLPTGVRYRGNRERQTNAHGQTVYQAEVSPDSDPTERDVATYWHDFDTGVHLIASGGSQVPGLPVGYTYVPGIGVGQPAFERDDTFLYFALVQPPGSASNDWVVMRGTADAAPTPRTLLHNADIEAAGFHPEYAPDNIFANARGWVVVRTLPVSTSGAGLLAVHHSGLVLPIVTPDVPFDFDDDPAIDDPRIVRFLVIHGLNNANELLFSTTASSPQGTGLFLATLPDPCPGDFNNDNTVDLNDYFDFLGDLFAQLDAINPRPGSADVDGSGLVDLNDYFTFLGQLLTNLGPC